MTTSAPRADPDAVPEPAEERRAGTAVPDRLLVLLLSLLGGVLLLTVLATAVVLPLTPPRLRLAGADLIDDLPLWSWLAGLPWPVPEGGVGLALTVLGVSGCAFLAYAGAVVACWRRVSTRTTLLAVLLPAVAFLVVSAIALPTQSSDMVDYLLSGRVAAEHGASPYEVAPDAFPDDPLLPYASGTYTDDVEQKPPVWIAAAVGIAAIAGDDPAVAVLAIRSMFLCLSLANLGLIALILHRWRPEHLLSGLVLYGWSPIVALHGQAKFDTLMASFALLAAFLLVSGRRTGVLPVLWLSVLVKVLTLPLLAVYALGEISAGKWRRLLLGTAGVGVVTVVAYLPVGGPHLLLDHLGLAERGGSSLGGVAGSVVAAAVVGAVFWTGLRSRAGVDRQLQAWALVCLGLILVAPIGWSWYAITPLAVVALCGERWRSAAAIGLSAVAFTADLWLRHAGAASDLADLGLSRATAFLVGVVLLAGIAGLVRWAGVLADLSGCRLPASAASVSPS